MAKTREQKEKSVKTLENELEKMKSLVFVNYYGLKVKEINELRKLLKEAACKYLVGKKAFLKIALEKTDIKNVDLDKITGGVGLVFGLEDEILPAKLVTGFIKQHKEMSIQGGIIEGEFIEPEQIETLAKLPPKDELKAQVTRAIKGPLTGLVWVLKGNLRNLVYTLGAIKK